MHKFFKFI